MDEREKAMEELDRFFEILEIDPGASSSEIRRSYEHLKALYTTESIVTLPVEDEMPESEKQRILREIEDAYQVLIASHAKGDRTAESEPGRSDLRDEGLGPLPDSSPFTGETLRRIRNRLGTPLSDIAWTTRIPSHHLENLESEAFHALPQEVYVRGFVVSYAKALSLDPIKVAADYMTRYRSWKAAQGEKA